MRVVEVLLPNHLPHGFDYLAPEGMQLKPGDYVLAPFGRRHLPGVVWAESSRNTDPTKLKALLEHYGHLPAMQPELREFLQWVARYTLSPLGGVLKMSLPVADALKPPSGREKKTSPTDTAGASPFPLSPIQQAAVEQLHGRLHTGFSVTLLDGVTGSGKTEVYFELMELLDRHVSRSSESCSPQILILLPEISLSVQWLERFMRRFGSAAHVWHSGLTAAQRKHAWRAIAHGKANVVVGARSALFLPFRNLQLIVADEEHDPSYKQEEGVIYHARDMAVARARLENIPIVLASATPSVETLWNVQQGKYRRIVLPERHGGADFAAPEVIDMRSAALERGAFISGQLRQALAENLQIGDQSMLFLNRRGYAPLLLCRACGYRFQCPQCSSWMVLHRSNPRLQCHHCGAQEPLPRECPGCRKEDDFHACGPGVERLAEEVTAFLPQARLSVIASDALDKPEDLQIRIQDMMAGRTDILIGTQMIAKGHHFKNLTLVGVVDADMSLGGGDLRASERTYQLLHQLSGRAGRDVTKPGRVLIQSFLPEHPVIKALLSHDRDHFMQQELNMRQACHMPPFSRLAAVILEDVKEEALIRHAHALVLAAPRIEGMEILGPAPAPLYRLRGKYRYRILVKAERNLNLQNIMQSWVVEMKHPYDMRIKIDIDPQGFL